jgi:predicted amidophosphoribosyltransferase
MATCSNCGNEVTEGAVFCDQCGTPLPAPEPSVPESAPAPAGGSVICGACGAGNVPGEAYCDFCGSPLEDPVPSAEAVVELEAVSSDAELEVAPADVAGTEVQAETEPTCPACGAAVLADEAFCANCGASLALPPLAPEPVVGDQAEAAVEAPPVADADADAEVVALTDAEVVALTDAEVVALTEAEPALEEPPAIEAGAQEAPESELVVVPEEPVGPAPVPVVDEPEAAPLPVAATTCAACGADLEPGDKFCSNCGAVQTAVAAPQPAAAPAGPRLVVVDSGAEIPLGAGPELLIGREDPVSGIFPDVDMTPHGGEEGGVSRRHARIIVDGGRYFVEDLDSTNFCFVNKQKLEPGTRHPLNDGDEIRCGRVAMILKVT